jgi:hypothetical protein
VAGWNTNDHGVNNAEGAMKWPAVQWRMTGSDDDRAQQDFMLGKSVSLQSDVCTSLYEVEE